jgi:signal transduction histidine kinase
MDALRLLAVLVYTFGAFAYGAMLVLWLRELGGIGWRARRSTGRPAAADAANGVMLLVTVVWFLVNVAQLLLGLAPQRRAWPVDVAGIFIAFLFPPLIMHVTWAEVVHKCDGLSRRWRLALWPAYAVALVMPAGFLAVSHRAVDGSAIRAAGQGATIVLSLTFIAAAIYAVALMSRARALAPQQADAAGIEGPPVRLPAQPEPVTREGERAWWSTVGLFGGMALIFALMIWIAALSGAGSPPMATAGFLLEVVAKSLPLIFVFVGTYFEDRFYFFDLLVKRGVAFLLTLGMLTIWLALTLPLLGRLADTWATPWLHAVALMPIVGAIPWIYRHVAATLDRRWLGRRFTAVGAMKHFVSALRPATSRDQALERAQHALTEIFGAPVAVRVGAGTEDADRIGIQQRLPVPGASVVHGTILMGPRRSGAPYFSQDLALLSSLSDVFGSVLDNLALQQRRREQEQLAQELTLHASRSELKALRAQINPHFLFNALNAIAGLIHHHPARADRTIEQLAEVFRYALRSSDDEWTPIADELEFVQAYLAVERARFGERLQSDVHLADAARTARIPTMMVQTLVENAVKHGLSDLRGAAIVAVDARPSHEGLVIAVTDNGPGFSREALASTGSPPSGAGYGLANIRHRLRGYFGRRAALIIERDDSKGLTVVSVRMPLLNETPANLAAQEAAL